MKDKLLQLFDKPIIKDLFQPDEVLDFLPLMVFITDKNDQVVYTNNKFSKIINCDFYSGDVSMKEIIDKADWNSWNENVFKISNLEDDSCHTFIIGFNSEASCVGYFKLDARVFKRSQNLKPLFYFFTAEDVTYLLNGESKLKINNALTANQKKLNSKTPGDKNAGFQTTALDRLNKELQEFTYTASHDLQEPLRKITTLSSAVNAKFGEKLGEEGKIYIEKINAAATGMKALITNLLQISQITIEGEQAFVKTDLNTILNQAKQDLDLKIEENRIQILQEELPVIDALPSLMLQLFNNLLSNAIKFSSKNNFPVIAIHSEEIVLSEKIFLELPVNKSFCKIAVVDNGIGFNPQSAKDIFKLFRRLHGKTEYPGTGIGLAICDKVIKKHNGRIWAESNPGQGAAFFIVLPKTQD